ncbi:RDD family protein [Mycoplasma sp. Pen4]|uniref:RDD family protein n=1 Tax=Mycoplasma sp. Pen4 TaxID=640330 RepID=UPI001654BCA9|nr:RDD family protein [Mycoplasma sp. Pen4]QNM93749.1 RDD family protein [Mycoplasma sp. Pen4]
MYKNAPFWKRFGTNLIDLAIVIGFCILIYIAGGSSQPASDKTQQGLDPKFFYTSISLSIVLINFYYLITPIFFHGRTIGMLIYKIKIIDTDTKDFKYYKLIMRNILGSIYVSVLLIIVMAVIDPSNDFVYAPDKDGVSKLVFKFQTIKESKDFTTHDQIVQLATGVVAALFSLWLAINTIGYAMNIIYSKKLSLVDLVSSTRIVNQEPQATIDVKEIHLLPFFDTTRKWKYFKDTTTIGE